MKTVEERAIRKRMRRFQRKAEDEIENQVRSELTVEERQLIHTATSRPEMKRFIDGPDDPEDEAKWDAMFASLTSNEQAVYQKYAARLLELGKQRGVSFD